MVGSGEMCVPITLPISCASGEKGQGMGETTEAFPSVSLREWRKLKALGCRGKKVWVCLAVPGPGLGGSSPAWPWTRSWKGAVT